MNKLTKITPYPNMVFSSVGAPPIPFSEDIVNDNLVKKRLETKEQLFRVAKQSLGDVFTRNRVTRHGSIQRKNVLSHNVKF